MHFTTDTGLGDIDTFASFYDSATTFASASSEIQRLKLAWSNSRTRRDSLGLKASRSRAPGGRREASGTAYRVVDPFMDQQLSRQNLV